MTVSRDGRAAMGIGFRMFLFEQDGTMRRISQRLYDELCDGATTMPEYAGQTLRFAVAETDNVNRRPVRIGYLGCPRYRFDERGSIETSVDEGLRDITEVFDRRPKRRGKARIACADRVVSIADRLEEKRRAAYRWEPTPAEVTRIVNAIWKT